MKASILTLSKSAHLEDVMLLVSSASKYHFELETYLKLRRLYPANKIIKSLKRVAEYHHPELDLKDDEL